MLVSALAVSEDSPKTASPTADVFTKARQAALTPSQALALLKEGNARFVAGTPLRRDLKAQVAATAGGQYPFAAVLSCMDSRVPVETVLDRGIGDLFSVRLAGNVVDPDVLGSLEYAAKAVGVKLIVVLGHGHCGAVKGAIDDVKLGNLTELLARVRPAVLASGGGSSKDEAFVAKVAQANVRQAMAEIRQKSPILRELLDSGAVGLAGGMYELETGRVTFYAD